MEQWYTSLQEYTYATLYCPISLDEGKAMVEIYKLKELKKPIPEELEQIVTNLTNKLQVTMDKFESGAFVKLSSRSAKDSAVSSQRTKQVCYSCSLLTCN